MGFALGGNRNNKRNQETEPILQLTTSCNATMLACSWLLTVYTDGIDCGSSFSKEGQRDVIWAPDCPNPAEQMCTDGEQVVDGALAAVSVVGCKRLNSTLEYCVDKTELWL